MTILGKRTVHELNDLVNALSYEVSQTRRRTSAGRVGSAGPEGVRRLEHQARSGDGGVVHGGPRRDGRIGETPQAFGTRFPPSRTSRVPDGVPAVRRSDPDVHAEPPVPHLVRPMPQPTAPDLDLDATRARQGGQVDPEAGSAARARRRSTPGSSPSASASSSSCSSPFGRASSTSWR